MELSFTERKQLREEEQALESAITGLAQRVKPPSEFEQRQMQIWQRRLESVRRDLGYILSPSGRLKPPEATKQELFPSVPTSSIQVADPKTVLEFDRDADAGVAFRIRSSQ